MRKYQQKQILESIKTLYEATAEIKRFFSRKDSNSVRQLLSDCQEMAIQIGNYIERLEGEGTQTVSRLEEYCQLLYQANVEINNIGSDKKVDKPLQKLLIKIENSVRDELKPNKIEVLFISYKASMSDSIESIYLAAKSAPCCDAFFVPIPYYDIYPDNSLGMMHYEGADCYGNNIEITDWREYNIEARHPDVIFTFNPYDEGNFVTRVHPDFFCRKLREYTDFLVYVPYFVVADDVPEHFCTVAGCIYAHKIIIQSEKIRDTYIRVFNETFGDRFGKVKDKFVALGSPKFDKVINTKREDCLLPDEWSKLINGKKVVLYNTTVGAILHGNEQYLKKLRHVLSVFQKCNDVILWWRPHPLSEATYAGMRPGLLEGYRAIVADYRSGNWGVYDDSPDLHRAIAWTDAYYGDRSSVVALYRATGKPVMISSLNCFGRTKELFSFWIKIANNAIWLSLNYINVLIKAHKSNGDIEFLGKFPLERDFIWERNGPLYRKPVEIDGNLWFPPYLANEVAVLNDYLNCTEIKMEKIIYKNSSEYNAVSHDFFGAVSYESNLFLTPFTYPAIVKINTITKEVSYFSDWLMPLRALSDKVDMTFFTFPTKIENKIWLAARFANAIVSFNMNTFVSTVYEIGDKKYCFKGICFDGKNFWITPAPYSDTPFIKWNPDSGEIKELFDNKIYSKDKSYFPCVYNGGFIWIISSQSAEAFKIDVLTDEVTVAVEFNAIDQHFDDNVEGVYSFIDTADDVVIVYRKSDNTIIEYNVTNRTKKETHISVTEDIVGQVVSQTGTLVQDGEFSDNWISKNTFSESECMTLEDFLFTIKSNQAANEHILQEECNVGENIYSYIKSEVMRQ